MARGRTETFLVQTVEPDGRSRRHPDEVIVEEPMTIQLDGNVVATTMRTPGNDYELAVGSCFGEGLLGGADVTTVRYCATGAASDSDWNLVTVDTAGPASPAALAPPAPRGIGRSGGEALAALAARLRRLPPTPAIDLAALRGLPAVVLGEQRLPARAAHVAAAFDRSGAVGICREDVGRHNAVDKVVGRMVLDRTLPATGLGLYVGGCVDLELVQRAWTAGFGTLVGVGPPTGLAVVTARRAGLTLAVVGGSGPVHIY